MITIILALLLSSGPAWVPVANLGPFHMVYAEPELLTRSAENGHKLIDIAVGILKKNKPPLVVDFFDNMEMTPKGLPYSDAQLKHLKARVSFPASGGAMKFEWLPQEKKK